MMSNPEDKVAVADQHKISLAELEQRLKCTDAGLNNNEATRRLSEYGSNELHVRKDTPEIIKFLRQFTNFFALLLIVGSGLAFFADYLQPGEGNFYIGVALLAVVVINATFTYIQEHASERLMELDLQVFKFRKTTGKQVS
jgi:sodium/potassium-transporting ATPase subunit alpha